MKKIFILLSVFVLPVFLYGNIISTVAGNGNSGFYDKIAAKKCMLNFPTGIFVDDDGNIYIADSFNNRIRKVIKQPGDDLYENSVMETIAGTGECGYESLEIPAINSPLATPKSVFVYKENNTNEVYFSDSKNNLIRKINSKGFIKNVCGTHKFGYAGDNGPAENAMLANPNEIFIDHNKNIYIADTFNNRIRVIYNNGKIFGLINPKKGYIYTIAGNGESGAGSDNVLAINAMIGEPYGIWVDEQQNIFIAQRIGSIISKIDAETGKIHIIAGVPNHPGYNYDDQPATEAKLNQPFGVTLDNQKNIFIADSDNMRIRYIDNNGVIHTLAGDSKVGYIGEKSPAENALLSHPLAIFFDKKGHLFLSDSFNSVIRMITFDSK